MSALLKTDTEESRSLILQQLAKGAQTANECIGAIFHRELENGISSTRNWRFYVHLNKLFAVLQKEGQIAPVDVKMGPTRRLEKVWDLQGFEEL